MVLFYIVRRILECVEVLDQCFSIALAMPGFVAGVGASSGRFKIGLILKGLQFKSIWFGIS